MVQDDTTLTVVTVVESYVVNKINYEILCMLLAIDGLGTQLILKLASSTQF